MDIFAHGLWTNAVFEVASRARKKTRSWREIWIAIFFGVAPDIVSFGLFTVTSVLQGEIFYSPRDYFPRIPAYVYTLYNYTHSLIIFALAFLVVWRILKRPYWLMAGWGLHIFIDIFSHKTFFPTPFLFPLSDFHLRVARWSDPVFMAANYGCIFIVYLLLYGHKKKAGLS